jgi:glycosyltransferase involved in cell wall biosynthesis
MEQELEAPRNRTLISICVPVFNEEDNIAPFHSRISPILSELSDIYDFEILFTDNHSDDATFERLIELCNRDPRVRVIRFSRNFGFQRSILTNYNHCRGQAAIQIDVDLQDPPELISDFLRLWRKGYQVVYGVRRGRPNEGWVLFRARKLFYRLVDALSEHPLPQDAGDFRLIDGCILDELRSTTDQQPYLRGMIAAMGFRQIGLVYDRASRAHGGSKFNFWRLLSLAVDGVLHNSVMPLRLATALGLGMSLLAVVGAIYFVADKLLSRNSWPTGFATLYVMVLFSIGMNATLLGILGEYIGRIYKNVKRAPLTIIEAVIDRSAPTPAELGATSTRAHAHHPAGVVTEEVI